MSRHTSFRIGGPADVFITPLDLQELSRVFNLALTEQLPYFVLGAGANILVADQGIRGLVIDMSRLQGIARGNGNQGTRQILSALAGTPVDALCREAQRLELSGIEFLSSMPGSIGGSIWMNARCYGNSIGQILDWVEILDVVDPATPQAVPAAVPASHQATPQAVPAAVPNADPATPGASPAIAAPPKTALKRWSITGSSFGYKRSPFQGKRAVIYRAAFRLSPGNGPEILRRSRQIREDRERKGHFRYPSAGSIFKNNRAFGSPTGMIVDRLGLKGYRIGDAGISELHGNMIINLGKAKAAEVLELIRLVESRVKEAAGYDLEREVRLVGEW